MPRGLSNWSYKDVINFLKFHGFSFSNPKEGSHEAWISSGKDKIVEINFIKNSQSYPELTLKTMIRQSGIDQKEWREWAVSGGKLKKLKKSGK